MKEEIDYLVGGKIALDINIDILTLTKLHELKDEVLFLIDKLPPTLELGATGRKALIMSKLGLTTTVSSSIGKDIQGEIIKEILESHSIDTNLITYSDKGTCTSIAGIGNENRAICNYVAATNDYEFGLKEIEYCESNLPIFVDIIYALALPKVTILQMEGIYNRLRRSGIHTTTSVTTSQDLDYSQMRLLLPQLDLFIANIQEAKQISKYESPEDIVNELSQISGGIIILTLGEYGSIGTSLRESFIRLKTIKVNEVNPVGAGDAYSVGVVASLIDDYKNERSPNLEKAMQVGQRVSVDYLINRVEGVRSLEYYCTQKIKI